MLSLPSESARSSTGRSSRLAAKDTQVMGWAGAACGGAPAASAAVSFFSRSPQASPSILIDTSGCVFSYSVAIWLRTAMVWGSVSVCQRRITFLSAAWADVVRSSRAAGTAAASERVLIVEPSLVGKRPEASTFRAGRQERDRPLDLLVPPRAPR